MGTLGEQKEQDPGCLFLIVFIGEETQCHPPRVMWAYGTETRLPFFGLVKHAVLNIIGLNLQLTFVY